MFKSVWVHFRRIDHAGNAAVQNGAKGKTEMAFPDESPGDQRMEGPRAAALAGLIHSQCSSQPQRFIALAESKLFNALWKTIKIFKKLRLSRSVADKLFCEASLSAIVAEKARRAGGDKIHK